MKANLIERMLLKGEVIFCKKNGSFKVLGRSIDHKNRIFIAEIGVVYFCNKTGEWVFDMADTTINQEGLIKIANKMKEVCS